MLIPNPRGGFQFLKGISPYSAGAVAAPGYEIVHAVLRRPLPMATGFDAAARHLASEGRPKQALCGVELRSPHPFTFQGFSEFNQGYIEILKRWDILVDGVNPVARINVAPEVAPPQEPSLFGFSYTAPASGGPLTFVVAGAGELPEGSLDPHDVVRRGETSPEALREKVRFVVELMQGRLRGLGAGWSHVTAVSIYTVHDIHPFLAREILTPMAGAASRGVAWHYARPPIVSIEYEMDLRGVNRELVIAPPM